MMMQLKKKVLLVIPNFFKLDSMIIKNLCYCGYEVEAAIYDLEAPFIYINLKQKLTNFFIKTFTKNKTYKIELANKNKNRLLENKINKFKDKEIDMAIFFIPDFFDNQFINTVKNKSKKTVAYQFDSIKRAMGLVDKIPFFDTFYSFDKKDIAAFKVKFATNFYFDFNLKNNNHIQYDFFYIGTYVKERMPELINILKKIKEAGCSFKIILFSHNKADLLEYKKYGIESAEKLYTYEEQEEMASHAKVLIDLKLPIHDGLSFRFFESMKFKNKILTNNVSVKEYDFYCSKNIFILNKNEDLTSNNLKKFVESGFDDSKQALFSNYSFSNWIKNKF